MNNEKLMSSAACAPERVEGKANRLDRAIDEIQSVVSHLKELMDKINPCDEPMKDQSAPKPTVTLYNVINSGPERIADKVSLAHSIINDIEAAIL